MELTVVAHLPPPLLCANPSAAVCDQDKLLEYDSSGFRRATFVFKRNKFSAICHFNLPSLYPQVRPVV